MDFDRLHLTRRARATEPVAVRAVDAPVRGTADGVPGAVRSDTTLVDRDPADRLDRGTRPDLDPRPDRVPDETVDETVKVPVDEPVKVPVDEPVKVPVDEPVEEPLARDRRAVVAREKEAFGGVKIGSAFFGWLTATGTAVLLTALFAAGGTAVGVLNGDSVSNPDFGVTWRGTRGAVVITVILAVAYFCGGYVAGRMARFNGLTQGFAVFCWAILAALVVGALGAIAGTQWDALNAVTGVPKYDLGPTHVTSDGVLIGLLAVAAALVGALLGGLSGMRFHRRVDRAGLGR